MNNAKIMPLEENYIVVLKEILFLSKE